MTEHATEPERQFELHNESKVTQLHHSNEKIWLERLESVAGVIDRILAAAQQPIFAKFHFSSPKLSPKYFPTNISSSLLRFVLPRKISVDTTPKWSRLTLKPQSYERFTTLYLIYVHWHCIYRLVNTSFLISCSQIQSVYYVCQKSTLYLRVKTWVSEFNLTTL